MSGLDDSQNNFKERNVDMSSGSSPEASSSSYDLPKAATKARKKLISDEEDSDFVPEEEIARGRKRRLPSLQLQRLLLLRSQPRRSMPVLML